MKKNSIKTNMYFRDKLLWLVFLLFITIGFWLLLNHQPWRDEAQAWLITRDLSVKEVFLQMPYEGTPPLWHLIITPFSKLDLPYESILGVHFLIAIVSIFILLFYSHLPRVIKMLLPFNYYFIFEYAIIARNYNLTILFLFILASLHNNRFKYPLLYGSLIALLSWTNVHSLAISGIILGLFIYDLVKEKLVVKNFHLASIGLALSGIISAVIIMIPYSDQISGLNYSGLAGAGKSLALSAFPFFNHEALLIVEPIFYWLIGLIWLPIVIFIIKDWKYKLSFFLSWLWLAFIFTFKHPGDLRHYGLVLIFFIFFWFLDSREETIKRFILTNFKTAKTELISAYILLLIILFSGVFYSVLFISNHQGKYFSGAKEMANYLNANYLSSQEIASYPSYVGSSLLPYMPDKKMYQLETLREGTYLTWDKTFFLGQNTSYLILKEEMKKYYQQKDNIKHVLFVTSLPPQVDEELEFVTKTTKPTIKTDEFLYLYKLNIE